MLLTTQNTKKESKSLTQNSKLPVSINTTSTETGTILSIKGKYDRLLFYTHLNAFFVENRQIVPHLLQISILWQKVAFVDCSFINNSIIDSVFVSIGLCVFM